MVQLKKIEGAIWRIETKKPGKTSWEFNYLVKYVQSDRIIGKYIKQNI
jgi:hypothetical protein